MNGRRSAARSAPTRQRKGLQQWLPWIGISVAGAVVIGALVWPRDTPKEKPIGRRDRDVIFLQSDFGDSTCRGEAFEEMWKDVMPQLAQLEFRRARSRRERGDTLIIDVYAVGNRVEKLRRLPHSSDNPPTPRIPPGDRAWLSQQQSWQAKTRVAHEKYVGSGDAGLYNLFEVIRILLASPRNYLEPSTETRLIFVGDMIHYDAGLVIDANAGQSNLFIQHYRNRFATDVAERRFDTAGLDTIRNTTFSVYGIMVPRCPSMPRSNQAMSSDYQQVSRELWPIWTELFRALGAKDVQFGLNSAALIKD